MRFSAFHRANGQFGMPGQMQVGKHIDVQMIPYFKSYPVGVDMISIIIIMKGKKKTKKKIRMLEGNIFCFARSRVENMS